MTLPPETDEPTVEPSLPMLGPGIGALARTAHEPGRDAARTRVAALATAAADLPARSLQPLVGRVLPDVRVKPDHACHRLPGHVIEGIPVVGAAGVVDCCCSHLCCLVVLRVAWTVADLAGHTVPDADDVAEALGMRLQRAAA
jgi:Magnesium chelatase, subunit ChlI C-terminal